MPYMGGSQEGTIRAQDYMMMAQSAAFNTATLTHGTFANRRFGGFSGIGRYMSGLNQDVLTARKIAGVTMPSRGYARYAAKHPRLAALAPSLGHALPSKYMAYWSTLAGNVDAAQSMVAMGAMGEARGLASASGYAGNIFKDFASQKEYLGAYGWKNAMRSNVLDNLVSNQSNLRWGEVLDEGGSRMIQMRSQQRLVMQGATAEIRERAASNIAKMGGISEGGLGKGITGFLGKRFATGGAGWATMGRGIAPAARMLGGVTAGIDVYSIAMFGGGIIGKGFVNSMTIPGKIYSGMTQGIHRGTFMSSSPLSPFVGQTGRQRAMANIYDRQLNLRQAMGNEAAILAGM
jgi:hypothetical protein